MSKLPYVIAAGIVGAVAWHLYKSRKADAQTTGDRPTVGGIIDGIGTVIDRSKEIYDEWRSPPIANLPQDAEVGASGTNKPAARPVTKVTDPYYADGASEPTGSSSTVSPGKTLSRSRYEMPNPGGSRYTRTWADDATVGLYS